jgi:predicted ATPase
LRVCFEAHGGVEMGTEGDSFFIVFESARDAVLAALEGQRRLQEHVWPDDASLRVRMGMHTGEPQRHEDGYVGIDVHRAARIAGTAHGGQTVLSEATRMLLGALDAGVGIRDLGWHRLKDLDAPEHLFDLTVSGLVSEFPPLRSLGTPANLPLPSSTLVGRDGELVELRSTLQRPDARLVTLTGPGGTGKTRLALAVAAAVENEFPSGVYFVGLQAANRAQLMWASIAEAVDANGESEETPHERVAGFLADRRALLVLDNLEQIPDADRVVSSLLASAVQVRVLATTRRPLHLVGEYEHPVPPLELPGPGVDEFDAAQRSGAVELFVHHARMVRPGFRLTRGNVDDVVELCRRLDGLPLAIELAAARSRLLTPRALLSRIDQRLGDGVTASDRPERQRSLGATIAWSYDLLEPAEQQVFRRLGVFAQACDLTAIEAVVATDEVDPLDVVAHLVDASLVRVTDGPDGEPRISMLVTIRSFARDKLRESGETEATRMRHALWCRDFAAEIDEMLHGPAQMSALDRVGAVEDDIRSALGWCLRPMREVGSERTECGFDLLMHMTGYWYRFGYVTEGRGWHERAVAIADDSITPDGPTVVHALHGMGVLALQQNDVAVGTATLERALAMAQRVGDQEIEARELNSLAVGLRMRGELPRARELLETSVRLAREVGNAGRESTALSNLVVVLIDNGEYVAAAEAGRRAVAASKEIDDPWAVALDQANLAMALLRAEGPDAAYECLSDMAQRAVTLADSDLSISVVEEFAVIFAVMGDQERAVRLLGTADTQRAATGLARAAPDQAILDEAFGAVRDAVDAADWQRTYQDGARLTIDEAVTEAVGARVAHPA